MEYRLSRREDLPQLEILSRLCFGEEPEFCRLLYDRRWTEENCLVAQGPAGRPVGFVFALPFTAVAGEKNIPAAYVYSLGVHPDWRDRGVGAGLMNFYWQTLRERGVSLSVLVPAEGSLFGYYRRLGYNAFSSLAWGFVPGWMREEPPLALRPASPEEYGETRERLLADLVHGAWDREAQAYQKQFSGLSDGGLYLLEEGKGCAVAEVYDGFLHVKELLAPPECLPRAASALSRAFPGWRMEVRTRPDWGRFLDLPVREFAMARWAGEPLEGPAYFGLSLD